MPIELPSLERLHTLFELSPKHRGLIRRIPIKATKAGDPVGSPSKKGYLKVNIDGKKYYVHRVVYYMCTGDQPETVDHEDRDKANNVPGNLRAASFSQQNQNLDASSRNTSGYRGVSWNKRRNRWEACISVKGKSIRLGRFKDPVMASKAYIEAQEKYYGEFSLHPSKANPTRASQTS